VTIVYGSASPPDTLQLGSATAVTRIHAEMRTDLFPDGLLAPDVDGDGTGDALIGASFASPNGWTNAGKAYLIHGIPTASPVETWSGAGVFLQSFPNPLNPAAHVVWRLDQPATVNLSIYDVRGGMIRTLIDGPLAAGEHRLVWDGKDRTGNPVASGVYFCRLSTPSFVGSRKLVVVR
jgi:hypothetical protein